MVTKDRTHSLKRQKKAAARHVKPVAVQPANGNRVPLSSHDALRRLYASMLQFRMLAEREPRVAGGSALFDKCGFGVGDEAVVVGCSLDMGPTDTFVADNTNLSTQTARTVWLDGTFLRPVQNETQLGAVAEPSTAEIFTHPFNLGTGLALTHRLEKNHNVVVALCADVDLDPERWHGAAKFAGIHKLPVIYVLRRSSASQPDSSKPNPALEDVSFMVRDCGFPAVIVDGSDAVAVWRVSQESIHRARNGAGPTMIDCDTHSSPSRDPLAQMEHYMRKRCAWEDEWRSEIAERIEAEMEAAVAALRVGVL
jgi:TPP-dependent pyruvate/acetoin dehydrogenase alpha subunit